MCASNVQIVYISILPTILYPNELLTFSLKINMGRKLAERVPKIVATHWKDCLAALCYYTDCHTELG